MQQLPPGFQLDGDAAPAPSRAPGIIRGRPSQSAAISQQNANRGDAQFQYQISRDQAADAEKREKERREQAATAEALSSSATSVGRTIQILKDIKADAADAGGWFETGTSGALARAVPMVNNPGKDLARKLEAVKGLNAFSALKDLASQGVKLTPISNAEIQLAAASVANIDPDLSQDEFMAAVDQAIEFHTNALNQIRKAPGAKPSAARTPPADIQAIMRKYGTGQ